MNRVNGYLELTDRMIEGHLRVVVINPKEPRMPKSMVTSSTCKHGGLIIYNPENIIHAEGSLFQYIGYSGET